MNVSSRDANNTVYLEKAAVSHTKQFFGKRPEMKKNSHFDGDCTWTARSIGKLMVFNTGFGSKINL